MHITYLGHSAFKLRGKLATVVTDPYGKSIGWTMKKQSADIVTISHQHEDHNAADRIEGTSRRPDPYVISAPGEYEISEVGVFGWSSYHDAKDGEDRGRNTIYNIHMEGVRIAHLGDLGHILSDELVENVGEVDVLLVPVGGIYTVDAEQAGDVVNQLQPSIVIPMHYKTDNHDQKVFGKMDGVEVFLKEMGIEGIEARDKISVSENDLPEITEVVVLKE